MNISIGIDLVEVARCATWHAYSDVQLTRMFSAAEIAYCRSQKAHSAERFAARFAAKEACYKAFHGAQLKLKPLSLLAFLPLVSVDNARGAPIFLFAPDHPWSDALTTTQQTLSISHTATTACAVVVLYHGERL